MDAEATHKEKVGLEMMRAKMCRKGNGFRGKWRASGIILPYQFRAKFNPT